MTKARCSMMLLLFGATAAAGQNSGTESTCGVGEEVVSTNCLGDSLVKSQARATAKMYIGNGMCTAWLVKAATSDRGALMLTTGHCAKSSTASFVFAYVAPCGDQYGGSEDNVCTGVLVAAETEKDEHGIYELEQPCLHADAVTPILLDISGPDADEGMYLIGHPNGRPQLLSHQEAHDDGHHCEVRTPSFTNGKGSKRAGYYCDTQGGNSGSPVFSARTGYAFAIHSHGGCNAGQHSANSGGLLGNTGIVNAFNKFGIPYVSRETTDLMQFEEFLEEARCHHHDQFNELKPKSLAECKSLCVNSLTCVGIEHSASQGVCVVNHRSSATSGACTGEAKYFRRTKTLTQTLTTDSVLTTTTTPQPLTPASGFCGFESSTTPYCGIWHQSGQDNFDWTQHSGSTPSASTGPSQAHGGNYYIYTEVSSPIKQNDKAILEALTPTLESGSFLSFFYHMKGSTNMGALKVMVRVMPSGEAQEVWSKSGNQGDQWAFATIPLVMFSGKSVTIAFIGSKGNTYTGDIAVDDVNLSIRQVATTTPISTSSTTVPIMAPTTTTPTIATTTTTTSTTGMPITTTPTTTSSTTTTVTTTSTTTIATTTTATIATTTTLSTTTSSSTIETTTAAITSSAGPESTTTTTDNPSGKHAWFVSKGSCSIDANGCALSPNYPKHYSPKESCSIVVGEASSGPIKIDAFNTEANYDFLAVNGIRYSGKQGPDGVVAKGVISWWSDYSVQRSGWKMCIGSTTITSTTGMPITTTPTPTTTVTTTSTTTPTTTVTTTSTTTSTTAIATTSTTTITTTTTSSTTTSSSTVETTTAAITSSAGPDSTTTTTSNPFGKHGWFVSKGSCSIDASGCALSPNYPSYYSPKESCSIVVEETGSGPITVDSFRTEANYDFLAVNGISYSGNQGPDGVVPKGFIAWSSDYSVERSGWKICMGSTTTTSTTDVPTTSTSVSTTTATTTTSTATTTTTTTTATAATTTTGQVTTTLTTTMAMSTTTLNIEGLTPGEAALYNPALASYWDLHHCAKASDNHNWSWCWRSTGYECQQEVQVEQTLCASGKASIGFSHRLSKIDGCIFSYYTQYVCQAPAGSIPSGPDLRRLTDIILV